MAHEFEADRIADELTDDMVKAFESAFQKIHRKEIDRSGMVARGIVLDLFAKAFVRANQQVVPGYGRLRVLDGLSEKVGNFADEIRRDPENQAPDYSSEVPSLSR